MFIAYIVLDKIQMKLNYVAIFDHFDNFNVVTLCENEIEIENVTKRSAMELYR